MDLANVPNTGPGTMLNNGLTIKVDTIVLSVYFAPKEFYTIATYLKSYLGVLNWNVFQLGVLNSYSISTTILYHEHGVPIVPSRYCQPIDKAFRSQWYEEFYNWTTQLHLSL